MKKFAVYIDKKYFQEGTQSMKYEGLNCWDGVTVTALTRRDAAFKAWSIYGQSWLGRMTPKEEAFRDIELYVGSTSSSVFIVCGLGTIKVYTER